MLTSATMVHTSGNALICELAASKLFGDYVRAFPGTSRDAGDMLRVAVSVGLVDRYQALLERALWERRPVRDEQWHGLLAQVSWPRALPEWARNPPEPVVIDGHGRFDFGDPWPDPLDRGTFVTKVFVLLKVLAVAATVAVVGSALRLFPARIGGPLTSRLDRFLAAFLR